MTVRAQRALTRTAFDLQTQPSFIFVQAAFAAGA
jgi:hypothetical protein